MSQLLSDHDRSDADTIGLNGGILPSNLGSVAEREPALPNASENERVRVIWGTNIIISEAITSFRSFLTNFTMAQRKRFEASGLNAPLPTIAAGDLEPYYPRLFQQV